MSRNPFLRPEHDELQRQVARFVAAEIEPHALAWDEAGATPRGLLRKMGALGWLGLMHPAEHGGGGADMLTNVVWQEALSRSTSGGAVITVLVHTDMASPHLVNAGTAEQQARWLPAICRGECITAVAVTEPDAGSDVAAIRTRAVRDGDHYVLDGSKLFIKQLMVSPTTINTVDRSFSGPVYSITPGGEIAVTTNAIFQTSTGNKLYDLPITTSVHAITSDYSRLGRV